MLRFDVTIQGTNFHVKATCCNMELDNMVTIETDDFLFSGTHGASVFWPDAFKLNPHTRIQEFWYSFTTYTEAKSFAELFEYRLEPHYSVTIADETALWLKVDDTEAGGCTVEVVQKLPGFEPEIEYDSIIFADRHDRRRSTPQLSLRGLKPGDKVTYPHGKLDQRGLMGALYTINRLHCEYPPVEVPEGHVICDIEDGRYRFRGSKRLLSHICKPHYQYLKTLKRWSDSTEVPTEWCKQIAFEE